MRAVVRERRQQAVLLMKVGVAVCILAHVYVAVFMPPTTPEEDEASKGLLAFCIFVSVGAMLALRKSSEQQSQQTSQSVVAPQNVPATNMAPNPLAGTYQLDRRRPASIVCALFSLRPI